MDPKTPRPPLSPQELIALRDGELTAADVGDVLAGNFALQRELLESRLLSLALSLAGEIGTPQINELQNAIMRVADDRVTGGGLTEAPESLVDTDQLVQYVSGEMEPVAARALERTLRGDARAFARLVEVKDAFFGQPRALSKVEPRPMPPVDRETIGTLVVKIIGADTWLAIERADQGLVELPELLAAASRSVIQRARPRSRDDEADFVMLMERVSGLQREIVELTAQLRLLVTSDRSARDLKLRVYISDVAERLIERSDELREFTRRLGEAARMVGERPPMEAAMFDMGEPPYRSRTAELDVADMRLEFLADRRGPGELAVILHPSPGGSDPATFTWVVPGVTFEDLRPRRRPHELGRVPHGSLLLIDRRFGPTQALKVEVREATEDFF